MALGGEMTMMITARRGFAGGGGRFRGGWRSVSGGLIVFLVWFGVARWVWGKF